jgi:hypothetical protein
MTTRFGGRKLAPWGALAVALAVAACGGGGTGSGGDWTSSSGGSSSSGATGASAFGTLRLSVVPPASGSAGSTSLSGKLYDGAYPEATVWTRVASAGDCTLYAPATPLCTPACTTGACVATNLCQPYPTTISAGPLTVTGVGSSPLTARPISGSYAASSTEYPPFTEGATVTVAAPGDASGAASFTVGASGIAPLALKGTSAAIAKASAGYGALALAWTAPGNAALAKIVVNVDLSHHGGSKGKITCEAPDTGSLAIPASLVTSLVNLGIYAYPKVELTRRATGSVTVGTGKVTLQIDSLQALPITIEGLTCAAGSDCTSGSCNLETSSVTYGLCK